MLPEPELGHYLEDVMASLYQAEATGRLMDRDMFIDAVAVEPTEAILGAMMDGMMG